MPLLIILVGIALLLIMTLKKVSPFLALLIVGIIVGLLLGMSVPAVLASIEKGVGSTLGGIALIICLGAILGKMLEKSGATQQISNTLINAFGKKNIQWAIVMTGFLIGIPLYYNAGFVILVPLVFSITANSGLPLFYIAIPMAASLSTTHAFLPPHPGPALLISQFHANTGQTLIYGLILAIPLVIIAGPLFGRVIQRVKVDISNSLFSGVEEKTEKLPGVLPSFLIALLPVILIILKVIAEAFIKEDNLLKQIISLVGDATVALLLSVLCAIYYFGIRTGKKMDHVMKWLNDSISGIALIVLIIAAGGVFKQVLIDSGTGEYITNLSKKIEMPPLLFGWLVAALLRLTLGSATVAGITAAGIVSPLIGHGVSPELMVLSVGAGSIFFSHVNDTGFWMFKEFFNLTLKQTFLSWSLMETIISVLGLVGVLLLDMFI
ncbi:MAG: gluconate:H+ symporter [Chitinophagaceae bacterium]